MAQASLWIRGRDGSRLSYIRGWRSSISPVAASRWPTKTARCTSHLTAKSTTTRNCGRNCRRRGIRLLRTIKHGKTWFRGGTNEANPPRKTPRDVCVCDLGHGGGGGHALPRTRPHGPEAAVLRHAGGWHCL